VFVRPVSLVLYLGEIRLALLLIPLALGLAMSSAACSHGTDHDPVPNDSPDPWPDEVAALMPDGVRLSALATCVSIADVSWIDERIDPRYRDLIGVVQYDVQGRAVVRYRSDVDLYEAPQEPFFGEPSAVVGAWPTLREWRAVLNGVPRGATEVLDLYFHHDGEEIGRRLFRAEDGSFAPYGSTTMRADERGRMLEVDVHLAEPDVGYELRWLRDAEGRLIEHQEEGRTMQTWTWEAGDGRATYASGRSTTCDQRWAEGRLQEQTCDLIQQIGLQRSFVLSYAADGALHRVDSHDPNQSPQRTDSLIYAPSAAAWDTLDVPVDGPRGSGVVYAERQRDADGRVVRTEIGWRQHGSRLEDTPVLRFDHRWICR